ncbi:MAG: ABC transporter permease [Planctomycetes bacterium]|nr:ABC transporter permease [Planctomycetota bacterium]
MNALRRTGRVAGFVLVLLAAVAMLAPWLGLPDPSAQDLGNQLAPPSGSHWFGTDSLGRDVFSRTIFGVRASCTIGLLAAAVTLVIGVTVGAIAGYFGRRVDALLMRFVDFLYGIPFICLVIFVLAVLRDHEPTLRAHGIDRSAILFMAVGATTWLTMARLVRNEVARLATLPFVEAARSLGASPARILLRHVLANAVGVILVALTLTVPSILLYEAFLSFLGLGLEPPAVSLGLLAAEGASALSPLTKPWWLIAFPGGVLALLLLALSVLGDGMRERLDEGVRGS